MPHIRQSCSHVVKQYTNQVLENVKHVGARLSKLIQSWQTEMGARRRPLCLCVVCPQVLGARERLSYLSTCCLSPGVLSEAPGRVHAGEGMSVEFVSCIG